MEINFGEVPMKFFVMRNGETVEVRRRRFVNPSFDTIEGIVSTFVVGSFKLRYVDAVGDTITVGTQEEWLEALHDLKAVDNAVVRLMVDLPKRRGVERSESKRVTLPEPDTPCKTLKKERRSKLQIDANSESVCKRCRRKERKSQKTEKAAMEDAAGAAAPKEDEGHFELSTGKDIVTRVLTKLYGEDAVELLKRGAHTEKTLGCQRWLSISRQSNGDVDCSVAVNDLIDTLAEKLEEARVSGNAVLLAEMQGFIAELCKNTMPSDDEAQRIEEAVPEVANPEAAVPEVLNVDMGTGRPAEKVEQSEAKAEEKEAESASPPPREVYAQQIQNLENMGFLMNDDAVGELSASRGNLTEYLAKVLGH